MASSQTQNFQLNQWAETDQVLRTDFNADNAKIDAAIQAATKWETLLCTELGQEESQVDLDLSDLDLSQFLMLTVVGQFLVSATCSAKILLNHASGSSYVTASSSGAAQAYATKLIEFSCNSERLCAMHLWLAGLTPLPGTGTQWYNILGWAYTAASDSLDAQRGMFRTNSSALSSIQLIISNENVMFLPGSRFVVAGLRL